MYPSKVHTHSSEHTHHEHTHPEQWAASYVAAHGEQLGVQCLAQGHLVMVLKVERVLYIHSPHQQSLPDRDWNSQPFDYESDSLTIRPRLPYLRWTQQHYKRVNRGSVRCDKTEMMLVRLTTSRSNWCS